ncbi:MAG TPA: hypothetical protein DEB35_06060 [Desulfuromonas sp.]|nr:hypothetical protein [Desulfuromonas sp.]
MKPSPTSHCAAILGAALLLTFCAGSAADAAPVSVEVYQRMAAIGPGGRVPVIVRFAERSDLALLAQRGDRKQARREMLQGLRSQARLSQGSLQELLRRQGEAPTELWLINALAVRVPPALIGTLAGWPGVAAVELDGQVTPPTPVTLAVPSAPTGNVAALGVQTLWDAGFTGSGTVVASFDSGVDVTHPDLVGSWRGGSNSWYDPFTPSTEPYDGETNNGHGTAVTSLMVGAAAGGETIGVAPGAQWIAAKIFSDAGVSSISIIVQSFQWALDPDNNLDTDDAPDVINNSWGLENSLGDCVDDTSLHTLIQNVQTAGIHVVFSAGNDGPAPATSVSPGNYPEGLAVGSIGPAYAVSAFSSRGPSACSGSIYDDLVDDVFPEVVAPGEQVTVAVPRNIFPSGYGSASGTSFSAPHVAGALALLRSAVAPAAGESAADYRLRLERGLLATSADLGPRGADNSYGRGLVDLPAAYDRLTALPHLSVYDPTAPENNDHLDFGPVAPGSVRELAFGLKNVGGSDLTLTAIDDIGLPAPELSLVGNNCPGLLLAGEECMLTVRFAPTTFVSHSGQILVTSNDAPSPRALHVTGVGNGLPPPAQLLGPTNGAVDITLPVTLSWTQGADADGDVLSMILFIDNSADFSFPDLVFPNLLAATAGVLTAAAGIILLGPCRNRRRLLLVSALLLAFCIAAACGGGGGGSSSAIVPTNSITTSNLSPATTYYWKVRTEDSHGGVSESAVWSFTTR